VPTGSGGTGGVGSGGTGVATGVPGFAVTTGTGFVGGTRAASTNLARARHSGLGQSIGGDIASSWKPQFLHQNFANRTSFHCRIRNGPHCTTVTGIVRDYCTVTLALV
jgi:hypothetical protein